MAGEATCTLKHCSRNLTVVFRPSHEAVTFAINMVLGVSFLIVANLAQAQASFVPSSVFQQVGTTGRTHEVTTGATWDWSRKWKLGSGEITGYWEALISGWSYLAPDRRRTAWLGQVGLIPVFRYRPNGGASAWFIEAGVGLNLMTSIYETDRKRFSTTFNFGDHVAVGHNFGNHREHEVSLRLQHFSNAGIRHPNPGENFIQLRYAYRFM
jgi:lipid A 3-O-deacylase